MTQTPMPDISITTSQSNTLGVGVTVSAVGVLSQQVSGGDAFQAQISIPATHSSQPTRHTAEPHMAPGPSSPPELQSLHINHINYLMTPQGGIFRTC